MPRVTNARPRPTRRRTEAGVSLIEVLIGFALLMVIALSLLPLFSRAASLNRHGRESTMVAGFGRALQEECAQLPFTTPRLTLTAGSERLDDQLWVPLPVAAGDPDDPADQALGEWVDTAALAGRRPQWNRELRVRQFSLRDLDDGRLDEPLDASTDPAFVHLKEVRVEVGGVREGGPLGRSRSLVIHRLRAY